MTLTNGKHAELRQYLCLVCNIPAWNTPTQGAARKDGLKLSQPLIKGSNRKSHGDVFLSFRKRLIDWNGSHRQFA